jgi:DmsE family decaheme c-type cytochrome
MAITLAMCVSVYSSGVALAADAPQAPAKEVPKDLVLKGDAKCTGCHDEADEPKQSMLDLHPSVLAIGKTRHGVKGDSRTPTCTDCHGDSEKHLSHKGSGKPPAPDRVFTKKSGNTFEARSEACLACHSTGARSHWEGSQHAGQDVTCTSCHQVHSQHDKVRVRTTQAEVCYTCHKEQRSQANRMSHHPINEGKVVCSDCHNSHGSVGPKLLVKNTLNLTCYTCHAEKRGPLLWEHSPVTDDCGNCHTPHGSTNSPLLKARPPYLCQECHTNEHASSLRMTGSTMTNGVVTTNLGQQVPGGINVSAFNTGRSCLNCHVQVHGSNHPAGSKFNR